MKNIKINCGWELKFDLYHEKQIELYVDRIPQNRVPADTIRFVFLLEAIDYLNLNNQAIDGYNNRTYDFLLTHNETLLDVIPVAHLFEFGTCWIQNYDFPEKKFQISHLTGHKAITEGHILRQSVYSKQEKITTPKDFYISNRGREMNNFYDCKVIGDKKEPLFDSQFHICIEQGKRKNYFSEKIIDCFQTKTIPIYWGCPNIGDWFNSEGIIMVDNLQEIIDICNSLDENYYNSRLSALDENYEKSKEFIHIDKRLCNKIESILNKNFNE
jgi:hypothetical protein